MKIHYLQHVPFEDAANIGHWAKENGYSITNTKLYENQPLPEIDDIDILAIMGGPMNIYQYRDYPWLKDEKLFIEKAINKQVKVIGVCLGAQLIADVLGAKVFQNPYVEIGWHDVVLDKSSSSSNHFRDFPKTFTAFHWHGDTFEIPMGAVNLASSEACANQVFGYDNNVIGLQFHIEYSKESIEKMLDNCSDEIVEGQYIHMPQQIRDGYNNIDHNTILLNKLLNSLCG